jgi:radical SAM superfamily enzyme YgiQ (UPF0313 family)
MLHILLISPRSRFLGNNPEISSLWESTGMLATYRSNWSGIGTGLLVVAALTPQDAKVDLVDENECEIDYTGTYDLVGITAMTQQAPRAYQIADRFRARGVPVVLGGIHPSLMVREAKMHADSVVVGEAEGVWSTLLSDLQGKNLRPVYRNTAPVDMTQSPVPRYDLLPRESRQVVWIQTSRGCPHSCSFCAASNVFGKRYRRKRIDQVMEEIERVKSLLGDVRIAFGDDNLFSPQNRREMASFLARLKACNIRWAAEADISIALYDDFLARLSESGCTFMFVGLESLSDTALAQIDPNGIKRRLRERYPELIAKLQSRGIGVVGAFIAGLDGDDPGIFDELADFVIDNNLYDAQLSVCTPLPGTRLRDQLEREQRLLDTPWSNYTLWDVNHVPKNMTADQLEQGIARFYRRINDPAVYMKKMRYFMQIRKKLLGRTVG